MPNPALEIFDDETKELKMEYVSFYKGWSDFGFIFFTISSGLFLVRSFADSFNDKSKTYQTLGYINSIGLMVFLLAKLLNNGYLFKCCCAVGSWLQIAFCIIILLHDDGIDYLPSIVLAITGFVILPIFSWIIYSEIHAFANRQRRRLALQF